MVAAGALPPPASSLRAVVVVPARDEEELIGRCLAALTAQRSIDPSAWEILVVLHECTDRTPELVAAAAAHRGGPPIHRLRARGGGAGHARARGMDAGCERLEAVGRPDGLLATTDADTRVASDWLVRQLEAVEAGASAIGGRVALESSGARRLGAGTLAQRRLSHARRLAAVADEGPAEHPHFAGASIGLTAAAYREVGGMEAVGVLEDEALARQLRAGGHEIHRLDSVRVTTSARTDGRAGHGLARDLSLAEWRQRRSFDGASFDLDDLLAAKRRSVSLILPAREVAETVGPIVESLRPLREAGLLDELIVVDADSRDGTARIARRSGAEVVSESELMREFGPCRGKGDAMWRAASVAGGELIAFTDADTRDFDPGMVTGLLGPILADPSIRMVKGAFERPLAVGERRLPGEGGRVTELMARPLLNLHFPELSGFEQPLAGEVAIERALFERLAIPVGYGVEVAMLIDAARAVGVDALAEARLGSRQNRHQPLRELGGMAYEVLVALERRIEGAPEPEPGPLLTPSAEGFERRVPACEERPPLVEAAAQRSPLGISAAE